MSNAPKTRRNQLFHAVFLHSKFGQIDQDCYVLDAASALHKSGHKVTIFTSSCQEKISKKENLLIKFSGWWIPDSICNKFRNTLSMVKAGWMAWSLIINKPHLKPSIIVVDANPIALHILSKYSDYKVIYIFDFYRDLSSVSIAELSTAIPHVNMVIVHSKYIEIIFQKIFRQIEIAPMILYPCIKKSFWKEKLVDMRSFLPFLLPDYILFVAFGEYSDRFNFKLVLKAFKQTISCTHSSLKHKYHLVFAGNSKEHPEDQNVYLNELAYSASSLAHQVTFIRYVSEPQKKTLIENCAAVIHVACQTLPSDVILIAMSRGRLIIALNEGFAKEVLEDGNTAILVSANVHKLSAEMFRAAISPVLKSLIGGRAQKAFLNMYSFEKFTQNLNLLVSNCVFFN